MIDMLVLRCPIRDKVKVSYKPSGEPIIYDTTEDLQLDTLEVPLDCSITSEGDTHDLRHPWEKIPSSYSSLAFKVFDFRDSSTISDNNFYVEIKCSPAKLVQGHNLFGSDDLKKCSLDMLEILYMAYPTLTGYLNHSDWSVHQVDLTYHSWANSPSEANQFINALANVSQGQTKARTAYNGTVYFGKKNTRIKKIKVYNKHAEVLNYINSIKNKKKQEEVKKFFPDHLIKWSEGMIRWESSIKTRWLERRNLPILLKDLIKVFNAKELWTESTKEIFKALEGEEMQLIKDEDILDKLKQYFPTVNAKSGSITYGVANSCYRTYRAIKSDGFISVKQTSPSSTFYRHLDMLHDIGFSKALLQNLKGEGLQCEVIPLVRYINVDFNEQFPPLQIAA